MPPKKNNHCIDCKKLIDQKICHADCCGAVPIPKQIAKRFEHLQQRKVLEIVDWDDPRNPNDILPVTESGRCVFLKTDYKCAIYDYRPWVCRNYGLRPNLECPYFNMKGRLRSPAKQRRMQRIINHQVEDKMRELEKIRGRVEAAKKQGISYEQFIKKQIRV